MLVYTLEQRAKKYCGIAFENHGNVAECVRKLHTEFGRREAPPTTILLFRSIVMAFGTYTNV